MRVLVDPKAPKDTLYEIDPAWVRLWITEPPRWWERIANWLVSLYYRLRYPRYSGTFTFVIPRPGPEAGSAPGTGTDDVAR